MQDIVRLRTAQTGDAQWMSVLDLRVNPAPWNESQYIKLCSTDAVERAIIADLNGEPCGFIVYMPVLDEADICNIAVDPLRQRLGIGQQLLEHALHKMRSHGITRCLLEVRASNHAARELYQSLGFSEDGLRKNYYTSTNGREDGILMSRAL